LTVDDLLKLDLKGHSQTVWSVVPVPNTTFCLTASADKLIKQWNLDEQVLTYQGHTDCVRGLALNPSNLSYFFSCSNDGTVIQWQFNNPHPLRRYTITSSFLYSICVLNQPAKEQGECYFATCGEDRSLRINHSAKGDTPIQTLVLPCQSLWSCICLQNTDIVIACNDGTIRLFTTDETRMASKPECDEYEQELSKFAIPTNTDENMAKINRNDLPGIEALSLPGKTDGQLIMINNANEAEVFSWNQAESRWVKIGVAVSLN
jgi:phospholipase A-2-activating protein